MIRETAIEIFEKWIEGNREQISEALLKFLNENKQKRLTEFCESLAGNIGSYGVGVNLNFREDRR